MDARSPHLDPQAVARALGGQATGYNVRAPAPNEGPQGRSLSITLDPQRPGWLPAGMCRETPATGAAVGTT